MATTGHWFVPFVGAVLCCSIAGQAMSAEMRTVEQYKCKDIMREAGSDRDASIAFLHGYLLGKSGASKFDIEVLTKQTDAFINRCLDNPNEPAAQAMMKVKS